MEILNIPTYVIHYTPLVERFKFIKENLTPLGQLNLVTEKEINANSITTELDPTKIWFKIGLSKRQVAQIFLANSYSSTQSRNIAHYKSIIASILPRRYFKRLNNAFLSIKSARETARYSNSILELTQMHIYALRMAQIKNSPWSLILEDDVIPNYDIQHVVSRINKLTILFPIQDPTIIFLNDSDLMPIYNNNNQEDGVYLVKPGASRNSCAYLLNIGCLNLILKKISAFENMINFPSDDLLQLLISKYKIKTYWLNCPLFRQGSETREFNSNLASNRE